MQNLSTTFIELVNFQMKHFPQAPVSIVKLISSFLVGILAFALMIGLLVSNAVTGVIYNNTKEYRQYMGYIVHQDTQITGISISVEICLLVLLLACCLGVFSTLSTWKLIVGFVSSMNRKIMSWVFLPLCLFVCFWMEANGVFTYQTPRVSGLALGCQYNQQLKDLQAMHDRTRLKLCSSECPCYFMNQSGRQEGNERH